MHHCLVVLPSSALIILMIRYIIMSPTMGVGGHIVISADPVGVGVSVGVALVCTLSP